MGETEEKEEVKRGKKGLKKDLRERNRRWGVDEKKKGEGVWANVIQNIVTGTSKKKGERQSATEKAKNKVSSSSSWTTFGEKMLSYQRGQ